MPRIKLAFWHAGRAPGEEVDVCDTDLAALQRDGRVAAVLEPPATAAPAPAVEPQQVQSAPAPEPAVEAESQPGRKKR